MKLKRKTPSGLFPSPYKTKYTRYPIHFYISLFYEDGGTLGAVSVSLEDRADLFPLTGDAQRQHQQDARLLRRGRREDPHGGLYSGTSHARAV